MTKNWKKRQVYFFHIDWFSFENKRRNRKVVNWTALLGLKSIPEVVNSSQNVELKKKKTTEFWPVIYGLNLKQTLTMMKRIITNFFSLDVLFNSCRDFLERCRVTLNIWNQYITKPLSWGAKRPLSPWTCIAYVRDYGQTVSSYIIISNALFESERASEQIPSVQQYGGPPSF